MSAAWSPDDTLLVLVTGQFCFPDTPDNGRFGTAVSRPDAYKRVRNPAVPRVNYFYTLTSIVLQEKTSCS